MSNDDVADHDEELDCLVVTSGCWTPDVACLSLRHHATSHTCILKRCTHNSVGGANPPRMSSPVAFPKHASAPEAAIAEQLLPVRRCPKSPPACALSSTAVAPIVPPQPPKTPRGSWRGRGGQGAGHHLPPLTISSFPLSRPPVGASSGRDLLLRATSVRRKPSSSHHRREPWPPSHHTTNDFSAVFCLSREKKKKTSELKESETRRLPPNSRDDTVSFS